MNFEIKPMRRVSVRELARQTELLRLPLPMPLERELLFDRIRAGGHSGEFLRDGFLSAYRPNVHFEHSLSEINRLDADAFRLFHQILSIRETKNLSDDDLFEIEKKIKAFLSDGA